MDFLYSSDLSFMATENHYADLVIEHCYQRLNFFYYCYSVSIVDKPLMAFINNVRSVKGLAKWIFTASLITVVFCSCIICK